LIVYSFLFFALVSFTNCSSLCFIKNQ